jgi:mRNA interferase MazF
VVKPKRGEVWLVDMGYAAKVRPACVLSIPLLEDERVLTTVVPHTTSVRGTRFETPTNVDWLKSGTFDAQGIGTYPTVKLMRKLGDLPDDQLVLVENSVRLLLELPIKPKDSEQGHTTESR